MILVVALNPALDVTHRLGHVDWAGVNRPDAVHATPGGKGVNVARLLHALGDDVLLTGFAGDVTGNEVAAALRSAGVPAAFASIAGQTRRTFAVVDAGRGETAIFNEPGPTVTAAEYAAFRPTFAAALARSSAVVLSGSLPPGVPASAYADLVAMAADAGVPSLLDTSGEALRLGIATGPAIVKPNLAELEELAGRSLRTEPSPADPADEAAGPLEAPAGPADVLAPPDIAAVAAAADELRRRGAGAVVVTLGATGLLAVTDAGVWLAAAPAVTGNPTGAGDAVAAVLAQGLAQGLTRGLVHTAVDGLADGTAPGSAHRPADGTAPGSAHRAADGTKRGLADSWPERLGRAAALGAAAVAAPVAGEFDPAQYERASAAVRVSSRLELLCR